MRGMLISCLQGGRGNTSWVWTFSLMECVYVSDSYSKTSALRIVYKRAHHTQYSQILNIITDISRMVLFRSKALPVRTIKIEMYSRLSWSTAPCWNWRKPLAIRLNVHWNFGWCDETVKPIRPVVKSNYIIYNQLIVHPSSGWWVNYSLCLLTLGDPELVASPSQPSENLAWEIQIIPHPYLTVLSHKLWHADHCDDTSRPFQIHEHLHSNIQVYILNWEPQIITVWIISFTLPSTVHKVNARTPNFIPWK